MLFQTSKLAKSEKRGGNVIGLYPSSPIEIFNRCYSEFPIWTCGSPVVRFLCSVNGASRSQIFCMLIHRNVGSAVSRSASLWSAQPGKRA